MTEPSTNGFAQKALIALMTFVGLILTGFFSWLAVTVLDIRDRVTRIEERVSHLSVAATSQAAVKSQDSANRIGALEKAEEGKR